ncbi:ALF repeat-containing protein [Kitasatospora purpeofusca]|uniref:ALF repeat-containing protein n=1 Tax=Kitasatospora purpeofusca TaxID=67352 RepID=UPI0004C150C9|nr:ALF repeat-containing protein [Kitasatospora purpeofusca]
MKLPKVSAVVAAAVLAPAVLFPSSASAADAPRPTGASGPDTGSAGTPDAAPAGTGQEDLDRAEVRRILADKASGVSVREAAEKALAAGTAAALREFLTTGLQNARYTDHRVEATQILAVGGPAVKKAAETALRGSYEDLLAFLKDGQHTARAQDDRVEIERLIADLPTWSKVREEGTKVLAVGTPAALRKFLAVDLQGFRHTDYRVRTVQIFSGGGPAVREAAMVALDGSYEEIAAFVEKGQYTARAEDDRAEIERLIADPATGRGVRETGQKALDTGTPAVLRHFLEAELPVQREHDARVALSQIMAKGGPEVRAAANTAMDGSYADVVKFLQEGQYTARAKDNRAQVAQIAETGGPAVKKAALAALDGNEQAVATFLIEGWAKARAEDEAAAKPGTGPTARPTEQPTTAQAVPAAQTAATGGQVVQAAARTTSDTRTGTTAGTRTTTGTTGSATVGSGQLAATGTEGLGLEAGGAAAALAAGAALVVVSRRRRSAEG